jgi:hypothetical protein
MNKVVLERYPVAKLPEDLRAQFNGTDAVTLTIEDAPHPTVTRADFLALIGKPAGPSANTIEGIRALRDEWD